MIKERDEEMRVKYYDPIECFPDKIDQLMNALGRVCVALNCLSLLETFPLLDLYGTKK